jgi:hypothetical protein
MVTCECGKKYQVGVELAGKTGQCRTCGRKLTVPKVVPVAETEVQTPLGAPNLDAIPNPSRTERTPSLSRVSPVRMKTPRVGKRSRSFIVLGIGISAGLLLIVLCGLYYFDVFGTIPRVPSLPQGPTATTRASEVVSLNQLLASGKIRNADSIGKTVAASVVIDGNLVMKMLDGKPRNYLTAVAKVDGKDGKPVPVSIALENDSLDPALSSMLSGVTMDKLSSLGFIEITGAYSGTFQQLIIGSEFHNDVTLILKNCRKK